MSDLPNEDFRAFAEGEVATYLATILPSVPCRFGNAPFKQPKEAMWAEFTIVGGTSFQCNLGGRRFVERTPGVIQFDVLVPERTGHAEADRAAERMGRHFAHRQFRNAPNQIVRFRGAEVKSLGANEGFYRCCVRVIYEHDAPVTVVDA